MKMQRGGFALGIVVGLLVGLSLALGVALYITKAPVPFVNKVPQRTAEQDQAEQARNKNWDPNAPLAGKPVKPVQAAQGASAASGAALAASAGKPDTAVTAAASAAASTPKTGRDPAAILSGAVTPGPAAAKGAEPFVFFVQAGAYTRSDEAEQQRAKLALVGQTAKITEREQNGRVVYRVRLGPFETRPEAEGLQGKLQQAAIETQLVRVERP